MRSIGIGGLTGLAEEERGRYEIVRELVFTGHSQQVNKCAFSGSGCSLASASADSTVRIHALPGAGPGATNRSATICAR